MNGGTRWQKPQKVVGEDEKKIQEARLVTQAPELGHNDSNILQIIFTDTALVTDKRTYVSCHQEHWTNKLSIPDFMSLNYIANRIYYSSMCMSCKHTSGVNFSIFITRLIYWEPQNCYRTQGEEGHSFGSTH